MYINPPGPCYGIFTGFLQANVRGGGGLSNCYTGLSQTISLTTSNDISTLSHFTLFITMTVNVLVN